MGAGADGVGHRHAAEFDGVDGRFLRGSGRAARSLPRVMPLGTVLPASPGTATARTEGATGESAGMAGSLAGIGRRPAAAPSRDVRGSPEIGRAPPPRIPRTSPGPGPRDANPTAFASVSVPLEPSPAHTPSASILTEFLFLSSQFPRSRWPRRTRGSKTTRRWQSAPRARSRSFC
jgi:hypothetical protein